jgi:hypothetical protein
MMTLRERLARSLDAGLIPERIKMQFPKRLTDMTEEELLALETAIVGCLRGNHERAPPEGLLL